MTTPAPATTAVQAPTDRLRLGVIGVGVVGKAHIKRLQSEASPAQLVAIADASAEAAEAVGADLRAPVAPSVADLLAREDVDAVIIAIPSGLHAEVAIQALDAGDSDRYYELLAPTEALSRQVFAAPTFYYKTGVAFLAWLNGHQSAFQMIGGLHSARSLPHLSKIVSLANDARALEKPALAAQRWNDYLRLNGVTA